MDKTRVRKLFDSIASRYDFANDVLSLGLHRIWERTAARRLELSQCARLLDLGAGSGRMTALALSRFPGIQTVALVDLSERMLRLAGKSLGLRSAPVFICGDGEALSFKSASFDSAIMAYSLRSMPDRDAVASELHRVLKPDGRLIILEFSSPRFPLFAQLYLFYLRRIIPLIGGLITGNRQAYEHLRDSIGVFPPPDRIRKCLADADFRVMECTLLSFGISTLYVAIREPAAAKAY